MQGRKFRGRILSAAVGRAAQRWCVSLAVEVERDSPWMGQRSASTLASSSVRCSQVGVARIPTPLAKAQRRLCHRQQLHTCQATWLAHLTQVSGRAGWAADLQSTHGLPA